MMLHAHTIRTLNTERMLDPNFGRKYSNRAIWRVSSIISKKPADIINDNVNDGVDDKKSVSIVRKRDRFRRFWRSMYGERTSKSGYFKKPGHTEKPIDSPYLDSLYPTPKNPISIKEDSEPQKVAQEHPYQTRSPQSFDDVISKGTGPPTGTKNEKRVGQNVSIVEPADEISVSLPGSSISVPGVKGLPCTQSTVHTLYAPVFAKAKSTSVYVNSGFSVSTLEINESEDATETEVAAIQDESVPQEKDTLRPVVTRNSPFQPAISM